MSGCALASHGGTYQPMRPLLPVWPASTAVFCWSMYFFLRSSWPQFSRTASTSPVPKPCQETSSLRSFLTTVQPRSRFATYATTAASASYPTHGLTARLKVPQLLAFADEPVVVADSPTFAP